MQVAACAARRKAGDLLHERGSAPSWPGVPASARHLCIGAFVIVASALAGIAMGQADTGVFVISAATIDAGGNRASGAFFDIEGSIAQPLAGAALAGGPYRVDSGFQSLDTDAIFNSGFE